MDEKLAKSIGTDVTKFQSGWTAYKSLNQAVAALSSLQRASLPGAWINHTSQSYQEAAVISGSRLLSQNGNLANWIKKNPLPLGLESKWSNISDRWNGGLKKFRDKIVAHAVPRQTPEEVSASIGLTLGDVEQLAKDTASFVDEILQQNDYPPSAAFPYSDFIERDVKKVIKKLSS